MPGSIVIKKNTTIKTQEELGLLNKPALTLSDIDVLGLYELASKTRGRSDFRNHPHNIHIFHRDFV